MSRGFVFSRHLLAVSAVLGLGLSLSACGGGDDGPQAPNYSGNYRVTFNKTVDNCRTNTPKTMVVDQAVSQADRNVTLVSGNVTLTGTVDADNLGFSVNSQTVNSGIPVTTVTTYRNTGTEGVYQAGLSVVAGNASSSCTITYAGEAHKQ